MRAGLSTLVYRTTLRFSSARLSFRVWGSRSPSGLSWALSALVRPPVAVEDENDRKDPRAVVVGGKPPAERFIAYTSLTRYVADSYPFPARLGRHSRPTRAT